MIEEIDFNIFCIVWYAIFLEMRNKLWIDVNYSIYRLAFGSIFEELDYSLFIDVEFLNDKRI